MTAPRSGRVLSGSLRIKRAALPRLWTGFTGEVEKRPLRPSQSAEKKQNVL